MHRFDYWINLSGKKWIIHDNVTGRQWTRLESEWNAQDISTFVHHLNICEAGAVRPGA